MYKKSIIVTGTRFGSLTVNKFAGMKSGRKSYLCTCDCGEQLVCIGAELHRGGTFRCKKCSGSVIGSKTFKHGLGNSLEYHSWSAMKQRCYNPKAHEYQNYGGRGIAVCEEWRDSFLVFLEYMGKRPTPQHSIDRYPDPDGNYEPGNCRWATMKEQHSNRSNKRKR